MKGNLNEFVAQGKLSVGLPWWLMVKNPPAMQEPQEMWVQSLGWKDPLEEEMATHSGIFARKIPWTETPGRLPVHGVAKSRTRLK